MEFLLFSPLEQFEFTLITGKLSPSFSILELLLPIDKSFKTENLDILLWSDTEYRESVKENGSFFFSLLKAAPERLLYGSWVSDRLDDALTTNIIETNLFSGPEGYFWYKTLDFFYIWDEGTELISMFYHLFAKLGDDDGYYFNWDLFFLDKAEVIAFRTDYNMHVFPMDGSTYAILAGYTFTDLYAPYNPEGLTPTLTFLTNCFYSWVTDRVVLNETEFNTIGLSGINLHTRDETNFTFFWLNIYNSLFMVITLIILIFIVFNQGYAKVPNLWQILNQLTFDFLVKSFISLANKNLLAFFPIFFCFFIFIYLLNLTALTPFSFCLTSNLWFSLSLSFSVWFGVTVLAIIVRGHHFFLGFVPSNISSNELKVFITIIEVISYVARALSLGVRIFANMLAGHSLVHILSDLTATCFIEFDNLGLKIFGIFPAIILSFILVIEFGICFLQGLVFVILTAIYLKEAFQGH